MKVYELKKVKGWNETIHHAHVSVEDSYSVEDKGKDLSGSYVRLEDVKEIARKAYEDGFLDVSSFEEWFEKFNKDKLKE